MKLVYDYQAEKLLREHYSILSSLGGESIDEETLTVLAKASAILTIRYLQDNSKSSHLSQGNILLTKDHWENVKKSLISI